MKKSKEIELSLEHPYVFRKIKLAKMISYNHSFWLNKKRYFFKYSPTQKNDSGVIVGEFLVSKLCKNLGVDCIDCGYAVNKNKNFENRGVISKSFLKQNEKAVSLADIKKEEILEKFPKELYFKMMVVFARVCPLTVLKKGNNLTRITTNLISKYKHNCKMLLPFDRSFIKNNMAALEYIKDNAKDKVLTLDECERRIAWFAKKHNLTVAGNIRLELQKMAIVDAITKQADRHAGNISLILNKKEKTLKLAPMYDNGMCENYVEDPACKSYPQKTNCYLKLTNQDYCEIKDSSTSIFKFFKKVCSFYNNGVDKVFADIQKELVKHNYFNMFQNEQQKSYWADAKENYKNGIRYIAQNLNSINSLEDGVLKQ